MKVKIIGVPIDLGSKPLGVRMGPEAIRYAGLHDALKFNDIQFDDYGNLEIHERFKCSANREIADVSNKLATLTASAIADDFIPVIIGGDHSASIGSIAGASKQAKELGLLWIDCHPDANTPETSPSGNIHGMVVAITLGYGIPELVNCHGFSPKVKPENICIIGAKDIDKGEKKFLSDIGVKMFTLHDIEEYGIVKVYKDAYEIVSNGCDKLHVSLDIDVLDPVIAPGTGIMSRGGLSFREISYVMRRLGQFNAIGSIDIIEINPLMDIKNQTSELAVELLMLGLGGNYGDYEKNYL